jgi:hypothetical protein
VTLSGVDGGGLKLTVETSPLRVLTLDRKVGPILGERYRQLMCSLK